MKLFIGLSFKILYVGKDPDAIRKQSSSTSLYIFWTSVGFTSTSGKLAAVAFLITLLIFGFIVVFVLTLDCANTTIDLSLTIAAITPRTLAPVLLTTSIVSPIVNKWILFKSIL